MVIVFLLGHSLKLNGHFFWNGFFNLFMHWIAQLQAVKSHYMPPRAAGR